MADTKRPEDERRPAEPAPGAPENEAAAEWGDRIGTGKDIARGGKQSGAVPGASPSKPADESEDG